ncbi:HAMP domain-containing sensor histidine kinase [uncultured Sphingomonas sp.]|uniref:sensor histidine kinase n=1 Tax=uncultured Sphingomonas sp. TaxID=158754 RepID=UPI0025D67F91|nr:HAMP domain-containing sensor histidine kinase [uncultured Sphingomonas sp.]
MWRSTTFRFAALVFLLQVAAAAVLLIALGAILRGQVTADASRTAQVLRDDLVAAYRQAGAPALRQAVEERSSRLITPDTILLLVDAQGRRIAGNLATWPPSLRPGGRAVNVELYRKGHVSAEAMRVLATQLPNGQWLLTGVAVEGERHMLRLFENAALLALSLGLIFAAFAAWAATRLIVTRLDATLATLRGAAAGDLARRVADDRSGDAFAALALAVNHTLERVETLVTELKIATDGLAHDLKSPLTRLRAALERSVTVATEPVSQDALDRALAESDRLLAVVQTALSISRAEGGIGRDSFRAVILADELREIAEIYGPLVEDQGRGIRLRVDTPVKAAVHRELLAQALGNLIDNSLKYGGGTITLSLKADDRCISIAVADQGPGIPAERRDEALRRFGRLDQARRGSGAGLGLALVAAVARLHDGALELGDARPGLIATLRFQRREVTAEPAA